MTVGAVCQCKAKKIAFTHSINVEMEPVPVEQCPATGRTLDEIEVDLRKLIVGARGNGLYVAADNMERFLTVPNTNKGISATWLQSYDAVQSAINKNIERFEIEAQEETDKLQRGQTTQFTNFWDRTIYGSVYTELFYASGNSSLRSTGTFTIKKHLNGYVEVDGTVVNDWFDRYDFHEGLSVWIPGFSAVEDSESVCLVNAGRAANYDMTSQWTSEYQNALSLMKLTPSKEIR